MGSCSGQSGGSYDLSFKILLVGDPVSAKVVSWSGF
ncbi:hypothetical protein SLEP1_g53314 [Rubroshorea leprosula]|uniref:Uncharacterized protein n=1 Tax=Rubroshorea leprosula TaxID=152421 RepID=A0AAV5MBE9_9ROSI|nr:hypothetical protein SLEP1_g53314 [Rubroshorea leprosula]